jgi:hypothetical protein
MLPPSTVPPSLAAVLEMARSCFTAPSFTTFCALVVGLVSQVGPSTVTGMLAGAGLSGCWPHDRAHSFFSRARWCPDQLGLLLARAIVRYLIPAGAPIQLAVDDTLFRRCGKKVAHARWAHDGAARGPTPIGYGNTWVTVAIVVRPPVVGRPVALPVAAWCWHGRTGLSRTLLAFVLVGRLAREFPDRRVHVVADAAYHNAYLRDLPKNVTWTCRLAKNAVLCGPAPARSGRRGRPRKKGERLGVPAEIAEAPTTVWTPVEVARYGRVATVGLADVGCQWYGALGDLPVRLILVREADTTTGYDLALITTDRLTPAGMLVGRFADRWSIEVTHREARQELGVGQARNRTPAAVARTVPFGLYTYTLVWLWYARHGHRAGDVAEHRARAPWYTSKRQPSFADALGKLRRVIIAHRNSPKFPAQPAPAEIRAVLNAWAEASA